MDNQSMLRMVEKYVPQGYFDENGHIPSCGNGSWYWDMDGKKYLDWSSGIFTNSFGHTPLPLGREKIPCQDYLANIHGRASEIQLRFLEKIFQYLPSKDYKAVTFGDGGGYTIDRGLTALYQHFEKDRNISIAAYEGGFHGKTQATKLLINQTERATFFENFQIPFPNCYRCPWKNGNGQCDRECVKAACDALKVHEAKVLMFEPIQGAGIVIPPKGYWQQIEEFCRKENILLFADEVLTGGGRTGSYLASSLFGIEPDLIAVTKGLANGLPLSVLFLRTFLTENLYSRRSMEYSSTFVAVPELFAVGYAVLEALESKNVIENVKVCGEKLGEGLERLKVQYSCIGDVRYIGLMAAVEFVKSQIGKEPDYEMGKAVFAECERYGLEVISSGHILRIAPPLTSTQEEIECGLRYLERAVSSVLKGDV